LARILSTEVSRQLGQQLLVENRPGAATNIASEAAARSAPDGYTLLLGGNFSHAVNPHLFGSKLPFDPLRDFAPVARLTEGEGMVIVVPAKFPANTLPDFIAHARKEGPKLNFASSGVGSPGHIAGGYLNQVAGLTMTHVSYKGSAEAVRDLVGGVIQMTITSAASAMPLIRDGRLKALAVTTPERNVFIPEVPGSAEAGLEAFDVAGWYGVWAPAGTPAPVLVRLNAAFAAALSDGPTRQRLEAAGLKAATPMAPEQFGRLRAERVGPLGPYRESLGRRHRLRKSTMRLQAFEELSPIEPVRQGFRSGRIQFHDLMAGEGGDARELWASAGGRA
jgi:tripartite-type tricarboxylate transporter receptor subunit TctC